MCFHPYSNLKRWPLILSAYGLMLSSCVSSVDSSSAVAPAPSRIATNTSRPQATLPMVFSPTAPDKPTAVPTNTLTMPTTGPGVLDDAYRRSLESRRYELAATASTRGPAGMVYTAYLFAYRYDVTAQNDPVPADPCRLAIYRWDGQTNQQIFETPGPGYPEGGYFETGATPAFCDFYRMTKPNEPGPAADGYVALGIRDEASDINQNGFPELAVDYWYCFNACGGYPEEFTHFYEIRSTDDVTDLVKDLPGPLRPTPLHSLNPLTFYVDDPAHVYGPHDWIVVSWIYEWDGQAFADVTARYADEYANQADEVVTEWEAKYGQAFSSSWDVGSLLMIPLLYEKGGQTDLGLDRFRELTSLSHWPGTDPAVTCWLKETNEQFQAEQKTNQPLSLPFRVSFYAAGPLPENCQN